MAVLSPGTPPLLTTAQVAEALAVAPQTVARWAREGKGPKAYHINGTLRFAQADVTSWLEAQQLPTKTTTDQED